MNNLLTSIKHRDHHFIETHERCVAKPRKNNNSNITDCRLKARTLSCFDRTFSAEPVPSIAVLQPMKANSAEGAVREAARSSTLSWSSLFGPGVQIARSRSSSLLRGALKSDPMDTNKQVKACPTAVIRSRFQPLQNNSEVEEITPIAILVAWPNAPMESTDRL